jgi:hypothetical protein
MSGATKLMTAGGGGVNIQPASSIASDVTVNVPSQNCTLGIQGPAFSAYLDTSQSISSGVWTKVLYNTEEFDTNSNFASSRFTPTVAGYYQFNFVGNSINTATQLAIVLYKNGVNTAGGSNINATQYGVSGSALLYANGTTDYFEVYMYISGATPATGANSNYARFSGALVRAA